jgi:hypothetical protein
MIRADLFVYLLDSARMVMSVLSPSFPSAACFVHSLDFFVYWFILSAACRPEQSV